MSIVNDTEQILYPNLSKITIITSFANQHAAVLWHLTNTQDIKNDQSKATYKLI